MPDRPVPAAGHLPPDVRTLIGDVHKAATADFLKKPRTRLDSKGL